jgi:hypothetical protein
VTTPHIDLSLCHGQYCFVAEILVIPGDLKPSQVEVFSLVNVSGFYVEHS